MNELLATECDPTWEVVAPHLDAVLGELSESDRDAVLLRYFQNKSLREIGQALGTSDDTAQKRISRAVERLRKLLARRGVTVGASGLVVVISAHAVQAAPVGLALTVSTAATMAGTTIASAASATATKANVITLQKAIVGIVLAAAVGTGIYQAWETWSPRRKPTILARDDGQAAGNLSMAGSGHVVRFEAPGPKSFLTAVQIHGKRYGTLTPPREDFHIWLCDTNAQVIADFPFPYARFQMGPAGQWVTFETKPTEVPARFLIVVGFNPTFTKGVHVSRDAQNSGESFTGLPGQTPQALRDGDWLIRVSLDQRL